MKKIFILALFFAFAVQLGFSQFFVGGGVGSSVAMQTWSIQEDGPSWAQRSGRESMSMGISAQAGYRLPFLPFNVGITVSYGFPLLADSVSLFAFGVFGEAFITFGRRSAIALGISLNYLHVWESTFAIGIPITWEIALNDRAALLWGGQYTLPLGLGDNSRAFITSGLLGLRVFF